VPAGTVVIDAGAAKAIEQDGKSLLPVDIVDVAGQFGQGALVEIVGPGGVTIGVGLCNYSAAELRRVMGKSLSDSAELIKSGTPPMRRPCIVITCCSMRLCSCKI
jgi:glutamate 5-kinase